MSIPDAKNRRIRDDESTKSPGPHPGMSGMSPIVPTPPQAKHWAKQYRTEIAASSSSVLSTFVAVSGYSWVQFTGGVLMFAPVSVGLGQDSHAGVCTLFIPLMNIH